MAALTPSAWLGWGRLQACGAVPHYFGLGFIQLKLDARRRLHFWVPRWPQIPGSDTELHDHRYDFRSTVLQGAVEQEVFAATPLQGTPFEGSLELVEVTCKPGHAGAPRSLGHARPLRLLAHRVDAGQSYELGHEAFHRAACVGDTITLVERGPVVKDVARVLRPAGSPPTCPFSLDVGPDACWAEMARMIGAAHRPAGL